jgi:hypothetical protein
MQHVRRSDQDDALSDHQRRLEARVSIHCPESPRDVLARLGDQIFASTPEAATVLRSDPRSVRRGIAAGDIPATRVGPRWLIPTEWLRHAAGLEMSETDH